MRSRYLKLLLLVLLLALGILMELSGIIDLRQWLAFARDHGQQWWMVILLILVPAVLFSFALAGSLFLWIVAALYPPPMAALILAAGATLGAVGAYYLSGYLTLELRARVETSRSYRLLRAQENFFTLFAMRVFPGFPHSVINYSAGLLGARLDHFIAAALLGVGIKSFIYARVIYSASSDPSLELLADIGIIAPLVALSLGSLLAMLVFRRV